MAIEDLDWLGKQEAPRRPRPTLPLGWYTAPTIVPSISVSVNTAIGVGVAEEPGEAINHSIHVDIRVMGSTTSLAARRYRR